MERDKILEKIEKLLNTTGRTPEEAATAVAMAQRLMAKYAIEASDLYQQTNEIKWFRVEKNTKSFSNRLLRIASAVAQHYRCRTAVSKYDLWLFGYEKDCQAAHYVIQYLWRTFDSILAKHSKTWKTDRATNYRMNNQFLLGFCQGVHEALKQNEEQYALVLYANVPAEVDDEYNKATTGKAVSHTLSSDCLEAAIAFGVGYEEGKNAMKGKEKLSATQLPA